MSRRYTSRQRDLKRRWNAGPRNRSGRYWALAGT